MKPANKAEQPTAEASAGTSAAESGEPRAGTKGNAGQQTMSWAQSQTSMPHALERIREVARERKKEKFISLLHHISVDLLEDVFYELNVDAAPGVDRLMWKDYEADLERNLEDLHNRVQSGVYRARPSRRVYIPKPDGRQRPLAVAALEDKIVQRAVVALLNAIYEEDFLGISYGFRPGRGTHDAMDALCVGIHSKKVSFILDADIRSFFDEISQEWLIRFLEHRIGDRRIIRLIQKWLKAGILEDGIVAVSDRGTGQGSVISPLLANIYLHYVLDLWAVRWRRREATGDMIFVRYADDFIVGFQHESDAQRFLDEMRERLGKFALTLHPEKTRLIEFGRFAAERLDLLHELVPAAIEIALLVNPTNPNATSLSRDLEAAANARGVRLNVLNASSEGDFDAAFTNLVQMRIGALVIGTGAPFNGRGQLLGALAVRHAVPAIFQYHDFAAAGGLMSYGGSELDAHRLVGVYTGRILKGEKPADLPVQQATKVELILNLKTAKALGLTVPLPLLGRADEVIE
jgi:group II intron reverse transcriptase/maturase